MMAWTFCTRATTSSTDSSWRRARDSGRITSSSSLISEPPVRYDLRQDHYAPIRPISGWTSPLLDTGSSGKSTRPSHRRRASSRSVHTGASDACRRTWVSRFLLLRRDKEAAGTAVLAAFVEMPVARLVVTTAAGRRIAGGINEHAESGKIRQSTKSPTGFVVVGHVPDKHARIKPLTDDPRSFSNIALARLAHASSFTRTRSSHRASGIMRSLAQAGQVGLGMKIA